MGFPLFNRVALLVGLVFFNVPNLVAEPPIPTVDAVVQHFVQTTARADGDQLLQFSYDVTAGGRDWIFLSLTHQTNARLGQIWSVYAPVEGGFALLEHQ